MIVKINAPLIECLKGQNILQCNVQHFPLDNTDSTLAIDNISRLFDVGSLFVNDDPKICASRTNSACLGSEAGKKLL